MSKVKTILGYTVADSPIQADLPTDSASKVIPFVQDIRRSDREHLIALILNTRSMVVAIDRVSVGTLSASLVHPREVFKPAILMNGAAVIVVHNHPSGDCSPSAEDKDATNRLLKAGQLLGIPLLDHIVVSAEGFYSFKEHGLL